VNNNLSVLENEPLLVIHEEEHVVNSVDNWAIRDPGRLAIVDRDHQITYQQLKADSDHLSLEISKETSVKDSCVIVCMERSARLISALLGIWKSGNHYLFVPIDAPKKYVDQLILETGAKLSIQHRDFATNCTTKNEIIIDDIFCSESRNELHSNSSVNMRAYISYTSGSTGNPKGVCVNHESISRLVKAMSSFDEKTNCLQISSCSFDASVLEIWVTLSKGGVLTSYGPGKVITSELSNLLARSSVNTAWLTSGLFDTMVNKHNESLKNIKFLFTGGDVLNKKNVNCLLGKYAGLTVINGYGPTENTTFTTTFDISSEVTSESVPIGRPILGTGIALVSNGQVVELGEEGEIFVFGKGLASGYVNESLNEGRFINSSFEEINADYFYATGDIAKIINDQLYFVGRKDDQVKVRGYRIELGHISSVVNELGGVRSSIAISKKDILGENFVELVIETDEENWNKEYFDLVKTHIRESLPDYFMPRSVRWVNECYLNKNGKIDKELMMQNSIELNNFIDSGMVNTRIEQRLVALWEELLKIKGIATTDDFFDLGGHSLLAAELFDRVSTDFAVSIDAIKFYFNPTIHSLSNSISELVSDA